MPKFWMISDRNIVVDGNGTQTGFGGDRGSLTFWTSDADASALSSVASWRNTSPDDFKQQLIAAAGEFPFFSPGDNERQQHVSFFIHGYNTGWEDAALRYGKIASNMFNGPGGLGLCVSFDWPSYGNILGYFPDREHAKDCAVDLTTVLSEVYDWLLVMQKAAKTNPANACRAKVSIISHSMGNFLLQKASNATWTRKNQPRLASLMNQVVMVAADVDYNLFDPGSSDADDGNALSNLSYRITSLFSGRDAVLGASAGLKHFGERRLGRSGLANRPPDGKSNVWDIDCSSFFPEQTSGMAIHGAYFSTPETMALMRKILVGIDRTVLTTLGATQGTAWPPQ